MYQTSHGWRGAIRRDVMNTEKPGITLGYRSLFWPIALIGIGAVWLLGNLGVITPVSLYAVIQLWPLLLIAIGLDLIVGRRSPLIGAAIAVGTVAVAIALLVAAPSLGINASAEVKSGRFTEPLDNATAATVNLGLSMGETTVHALADSNALIDANLTYMGDIDFGMTGDAQKIVRLRQAGSFGFNWLPLVLDGKSVRWDVGLAPQIPIDLRVDASSGSATLNLRDIKVRALQVDASSGSLIAHLPSMPARYDVRVEASSGALTFNLADNSEVNASIDMSSGHVTFDVPDDAGVQVNVRDSSSGSVNVPSGYKRTADNGRNRGTWESPNFANAERQIVLTVTDMSSGTFEVR
jgi:hypothetical protein